MQRDTVSMRYAVDATGLSIGISALLIVLGLTAVVIAGAVGIALSILILWIIVFAGMANLVHAWDARETPLFAWRLLVGLLFMAGGIFLLFHPRYDIPFVTLFIAWMIGFESMLLLAAYGWLRRLPGAGWLALDGAVTLAIACLIGFLWPWMALWMLGVLVGLDIMSTGATRLALAWAQRSHGGGASR